ncbi:PREDICTED: mucin-13 [Mesitornis unicolor]|nr:PREDICTED: mucin-13 [Mesitornis unicolor]
MRVLVAETAMARNNFETNTTSPPEMTTSGDLCSSNPCGKALAKCVALHSIFNCLCDYGFYYRDKDCHKAKIFPGVITLTESYSDGVQVVNSTQYEAVFQNITEFFEDAFINVSGFEQTVIVKIEKVWTQLWEAKKQKVRRCDGNRTLTAAKYCDVFNCDNDTTTCKENVFPECQCRSGFSKTEWDVRSCSDCDENCSAEEHKYCAKENGVPTCKCMPNFKEKDSKCVSCPVGYSGENCKNNGELIAIVVGTVLGAVILILVIAISVVSVRAKHKRDPEKKSLIKSGYSNSNTYDDRQTTMFPRVQTTSGHMNAGYQPNNPCEMRPTNRDRFPERDYDDLYEVSREPEGFRMQRRY